MKQGTKTLLLIIFLLAGIAIGAIVTELVQNNNALNFLVLGKSFGIGASNPVVLNLGILSLTLGISIKLNLAVIIFVFLSMFAYKKFIK